MTACVYGTVRGTTRTDTVEHFPMSCERDDTTLWDFTLTFAVNSCLGLGFLSPHCIYRNICQCSGFILSTSLFIFLISSLCLSSAPASMAAQLQPSAGRGLLEWLTRPPLDSRRVERERYFPWEWAVTPAGQWSISTLVPYQPCCKPVKAVGKSALRNHRYSTL